METKIKDAIDNTLKKYNNASYMEKECLARATNTLCQALLTLAEVDRRKKNK